MNMGHGLGCLKVRDDGWDKPVRNLSRSEDTDELDRVSKIMSHGGIW